MHYLQVPCIALFGSNILELCTSGCPRKIWGHPFCLRIVELFVSVWRSRFSWPLTCVFESAVKPPLGYRWQWDCSVNIACGQKCTLDSWNLVGFISAPTREAFFGHFLLCRVVLHASRLLICTSHISMDSCNWNYVWLVFYMIWNFWKLC